MAGMTRINEPQPPPAPSQAFALWQLGFRPFYLLASVFAALSIGLWALQFTGWLVRPYLQGPMWHAHEMLFGFALAVIVGFLLTAGSNWSNRSTLSQNPECRQCRQRLYALRYWPVLTRPRLDGRPG